jgi:hypothetical protein
MASRIEAPDALDDFPTPPWATRALCEVLERDFKQPLAELAAWDPAANRGHMVRALEEYFGAVHASDIHDYGAGFRVADFLVRRAEPTLWSQDAPAPECDWLITNPPFRLAEEFAHVAFEHAAEGVALLCRLQFLEGGDRFRSLFAPRPPTLILQFCDRVVMVKGRLEGEGSTATAYAWFVWLSGAGRIRVGSEEYSFGRTPRVGWFPPGTRARIEKAGDYQCA